MYESTSDIVKTAALVLAILIPALTGYWIYRREERKHAAAMARPTLPPSSMGAIGGLLLAEDNVERVMQTAHEVKQSINRLATAMERRNERDNVMKAIGDNICDQMTAMRRTNEEVAEALLRVARTRARG